MNDPTEMSLFVQLNVEEHPPSVLDVGVVTGLQYDTKAGRAVLVTVDAGNLGDSCRALAGLIRGEPKYAWVKKWPKIDHFLSQWETS